MHSISSFPLDRGPLALLLASRLGGCDAVFESAIRGSSMSPAIPGRVRLRVQLLVGQPCHPGDIVYFLADSGFMVHRLVHQPRGCAAGSYVITFGDNCLVPDPPVKWDRILGTVIAIETANGWQPPFPQRTASIYHRFCRAMTYAATAAAFSLSISAARKLTVVLSSLESAGRAPVGRLLRRLRLIPPQR